MFGRLRALYENLFRSPQKRLEFFNNFDHKKLWDDSDYSIKEYVAEAPSEETIKSVEDTLGYKLPESYIELMKQHNGGVLANGMSCFPCNEATSWSQDHVAVTGIFGIAHDKTYSLCGSLGSRFMIDAWGYPDIGVYICSCPSAGHDMVMLDYSKCGKNGEPEVVHIDQEDEFKKTFLAKNFESFIRGLVGEDVYDTSDLDLEMALMSIKAGSFSDLLQEFLDAERGMDFSTILRNLFTEIAKAKRNFSLHDDALSHLAYDLQFHLFSRSRKVCDGASYLEEYSAMMAMAKSGISTGGYAPFFVEDWLKKRMEEGAIIQGPDGSLGFSDAFTEELTKQLRRFR